MPGLDPPAADADGTDVVTAAGTLAEEVGAEAATGGVFARGE